ncbi:malate dehydrogenase [Alicyclobacillus acidiphilus]|uniref:malate dehydrogenase n=1 Tax=Alicyclobacillus acidiphilus TaxID=182455 RepID=UPI00082D6062|nr:malate dehydrogenase [Alicyclobacillus acidiphilus]
MANRTKVTIFGAGGTGGAIAELLALDNFGEVVLIDTQRALAEGKALDIGQAGAIAGRDGRVLGGDDVQMAAGSDIVVVTAGIGRKPGLAREELISVNGGIMQEIARAIKQFASDAFVVVLTNPADILTRVMWEETGFPAHRVMGQGGILDSARLVTAISNVTGISQNDIRAMVLGGHGDHMLPIRRFTTIHGVPADEFLTEEDWEASVIQTRYGGGKILEKFQTHGAAVTPAHAVVTMIHALTSPIARLLPVSAKSDGAYGLHPDVFIGLPVRLSNRGIERIVEVELLEEELRQLHESAAIMNEAFQAWKAAQ